MRIKIKPNTIVFERVAEWELVREKIKQDFGSTIFAISWKLKRELGFTVRYHEGLLPNIDKTQFYMQHQVHLDFFNESSHSWFVLKYINFD
jgi:hypothetical protein